jgi:hypothetical protein
MIFKFEHTWSFKESYLKIEINILVGSWFFVVVLREVLKIIKTKMGKLIAKKRLWIVIYVVFLLKTLQQT